MSNAIGFDLGGNSIKVGVVTSVGELLAERSLPTQVNDAALVVADVLEMIGRLRTEYDIAAVGLASTGVIDSVRGVVLQSNTIKNYKGTDWAQLIGQSHSLPLAVENDVNAAAWGEFKQTHRPAQTTSALIAIGTGIGCGIIIDGKIWPGASFAAGELSYMTLEVNGPFYDGMHGPAQLYASDPGIVAYVRNQLTLYRQSIIRELTDHDLNRVSIAVIAQAEQQDDELALEAFTFAGQRLGATVVNFVHVLNPHLIILGGGLVDASPTFVQAAKDFAHRYMLEAAQSELQITTAQLGNKAAVIGSALLALDKAGLAA
jgi:glucokinase